MAVLVLLATGMAGADLAVNPLFGNDGVLQRDKPAPIWGDARPGEIVTVEFRGQTVTATADEQGRWRAELAPMPADGTGTVLRISGSQSENIIELENIVTGDVWFCAGQSNMAWTLQNSDHAAEELAAADYPLIRYFRVTDHPADEPQTRVRGLHWRITVPGTDHAGDQPTITRVHSAVAYFFARNIHRELGVPVGLIVSARGGTQIESWMSEPDMRNSRWWDDIASAWQERLDDYPRRLERYNQDLRAWEIEAAAAEAGGEDPPRKPRPPEVMAGSRWMPAGLFNGMVHPVLPMAIRGILWYQGESNAGRHAAYAELFPAMITHWRRDFGQGDLPFYFVQLANFIVKRDATHETWAYLREAQTQALRLPNTGMAVAVDVGDPDNVHPGNKQAVGDRLARLALAHTYGLDIQWSGPVMRDTHFDAHTVAVAFDHAQGLELRPAPAGGFLLAGEDRVFHPATAEIAGDRITVAAPAVSRPVALRYAWGNNPPAPLFNQAGLPAAPFRTDDWPCGAAGYPEP